MADCFICTVRNPKNVKMYVVYGPQKAEYIKYVLNYDYYV